MKVWTRRLTAAGAALAVTAAAGCGVVDRSPAKEHARGTDAVEASTAGSHCRGPQRAAPKPGRGWRSEQIHLNGRSFVVRLPDEWSLADEGDATGDAYALVPNDGASVAVALAGGGAVEDVRRVADLADALAEFDGRPPRSSVAFAGGPGCRVSVAAYEGGEQYEVWLADRGLPLAAIAAGEPGDPAWQDAEAIVGSIEPGPAR